MRISKPALKALTRCTAGEKTRYSINLLAFTQSEGWSRVVATDGRLVVMIFSPDALAVGRHGTWLLPPKALAPFLTGAGEITVTSETPTGLTFRDGTVSAIVPEDTDAGEFAPFARCIGKSEIAPVASVEATFDVKLFSKVLAVLSCFPVVEERFDHKAKRLKVESYTRFSMGNLASPESGPWWFQSSHGLPLDENAWPIASASDRVASVFAHAVLMPVTT